MSKRYRPRSRNSEAGPVTQGRSPSSESLAEAGALARAGDPEGAVASLQRFCAGHTGQSDLQALVLQLANALTADHGNAALRLIEYWYPRGKPGPLLEFARAALRFRSTPAASITQEDRKLRGDPGVPKIIHQTYSTHSYPHAFESPVRRMRESNPDWEYRFYDDGDIARFIARHYGREMLALWQRVNPDYGASRADLFRYLLVYECGGLYLDLKSTSERPLTEILPQGNAYLLSQWPNAGGQRFAGWGYRSALGQVVGGELQQWYLVSSPGHPFLKAVIRHVTANIQDYDEARYGVGKAGAVNVTGPVAYTKAILQVLGGSVYRFVDAEKDLGLRYDGLSDASKLAHVDAFGSHYSKLRSPVVLPEKNVQIPSEMPRQKQHR